MNPPDQEDILAINYPQMIQEGKCSRKPKVNAEEANCQASVYYQGTY